MRALATLLAAAALAAPLASAQNAVGVLKNGPAQYFNEEDNRLFLETWRKALEETPDEQTLSWQNPKSRANGDIKVLRSFEWQSHPCKDLLVRNEAQGRKGDNTLHVCKVSDKWRLVSDSQLKKK